MSEPIRVLVADDQALVRSGFAALLDALDRRYGYRVIVALTSDHGIYVTAPRFSRSVSSR